MRSLLLTLAVTLSFPSGHFAQTTFATITGMVTDPNGAVIPGAVVGSVSAYGHMGGVQELTSRAALTDEAKNVLQSKF